jgi:hypothetical protein
MKKNFLLLFVILHAISNGQTLSFEGKIIDKFTQEPIPFATVFAQQSTQGVISNEDGVFKFYIPADAESIEISHLGYKSKIYPVKEIKTPFTIIQLELDEFTLEEVIVTNKPINQILEGLLSISKSQLDKNIKLETYYREFVKINDKYSKFADGIIDFYVQPKKKEKVEGKLVVNQSRAFQLVSADEIEKKGNADLSEIDSFFDIQKAANAFFTYEYIQALSSESANENYEFELRSTKDQYGNALEIIYIKPKPNVEKALLVGKVTYNPENKVILDIDIKMSEKHKQFVETINAVILKFAVHDVQIKQTYKYINGKYIPAYRKSILDIHIKFGKKINDRMMCISDLVVTNYLDDVSILPEKDKIFKARSLYSNGMSYTEKFWETGNALPLSENEERILQSLKNN